MTNVTLEMLGFLMLNQNLLVIKLSVTIPTPWLTLLLLLPAHYKLPTTAATTCQTMI